MRSTTRKRRLKREEREWRISDEAIDDGRIRVITVRGTQDLEDILLDVDIKGISPGEDLVNESKDLSTRLISFFGKRYRA